MTNLPTSRSKGPCTCALCTRSSDEDDELFQNARQQWKYYTSTLSGPDVVKEPIGNLCFYCGAVLKDHYSGSITATSGDAHTVVPF